MSHRVFVALGSNLGDTEANLRDAVTRLQPLAVGKVRGSSIWDSEPEGFSNEVPGFQNAVVGFTTRLDPHQLLSRLQEIEREMGRVEKSHDGFVSRIIDLDIIDYEGVLIKTAELQLPHHGAADRLFVLLPLQELAPDFIFQGRSESLQALIDAAPRNTMKVVSPLIPSV